MAVIELYVLLDNNGRFLKLSSNLESAMYQAEKIEASKSKCIIWYHSCIGTSDENWQAFGPEDFKEYDGKLPLYTIKKESTAY